jgi:hypothetical protein
MLCKDLDFGVIAANSSLIEALKECADISVMVGRFNVCYVRAQLEIYTAQADNAEGTSSNPSN